VWAKVPDRVDVLLTHGPPHGILDATNRGEDAGCRDLFDRVLVVKPRLHVFGHIHEAAGQTEIDGTVFVNASTQMGPGRGVVVELDVR
jgi:Icc-related predicted phosphoesterase